MTLTAEKNSVVPLPQESFSYEFGEPKPRFGHPMLGSQYNFTRTRTESGQAYFEHPFVDVRALVETASKDPVVEIAGPSEGGYMYLKDARLSSRPIITNIASSQTFSEPGKVEELTDFDRENIDIMLDGGRMPFADRSLGMLLASCLPLLDIHNPILFHHLSRETGNRVLYRAASKIARGEDASYEAELSPRVGFWLEAERVLKDGGVVIYTGTSWHDVTMATALGFSVVAHSPLNFEQYIDEKAPHLRPVPREIVFEKTGKHPNIRLVPTAWQTVQAATRVVMSAAFPESD